MAIFGKLPIDPSSAANEIILKVRDETNDNRPNWNATVKKVLRERADKNLYHVYPDPEVKNQGWLLDLIWFDRQKGTVQLAVESELGTEGEVLDDFQKLLCIKAPLKIMIYYAYKKSYVNNFVDYMMAFDQHVKDEHYLVVEFAPGPEDKAYLYQVPNDGRLTKQAEFSKLILGKQAAA